MAHVRAEAQGLSLALLLLALLPLSSAERHWLPGRFLETSTVTPTAANAYTSALEVDALLAIKKSVGNPRILGNWQGTNPCAFYGVVCNQVVLVEWALGIKTGLPKGRWVVTGLDLNAFGLSGTLPPKIAALKFLGFIHISHNKFVGRLPDLSPLRFLHELDVSCNKLSGPFPVSILTLKRLKYLDMRYNAFTGRLPAQLFQLGLDVLAVNNNKFNSNPGMWQTLPQSNASLLILANNPLGGSLPDLSPLANSLEELEASNVGLQGNIPASFGRLQQARLIDVSKNRLTGVVPTSDVRLPNLKLLNLANNLLGQDVQSLKNLLSLPNIQNLTIASNYFSGVAALPTGLAPKLFAPKNCIVGFPNQRDKASCAKHAKMAGQ